MLIPQLQRLDSKLPRREKLAAMYAERLGQLNWLQIPSVPQSAYRAAPYSTARLGAVRSPKGARTIAECGSC